MPLPWEDRTFALMRRDRALLVYADQPQLWKEDIARSVDFYNKWFLRFAPGAYRTTGIRTTKRVESALLHTANLTDIAPAALRRNPAVLTILRQATAPSLARDRLVGLAGVSASLLLNMEKGWLPRRMKREDLDAGLEKMGTVIRNLIDEDIFPWVEGQTEPSDAEVRRAAEAVKVGQLRNTYGSSVRFVLLLCGYLNSGYLRYEAAEGIDWLWEHRIDDFSKFGT